MGRDKQQSTKGEREGGDKPLTHRLVLRDHSPRQRWEGAAALGLGWGRTADKLATQCEDGGGGRCHLLCLVWFLPSSKKLATPGPDVIDVRLFLPNID